MTISIVIALLVLLGGCASTIDIHNPDSLPIDKLSTVSTDDVGLWIGDFEILTSILAAYDENGEKVIEAGDWGTTPKSVSLAEGKYQFVIRCDSRGLYNDHRITISLGEGIKYRAYCLGKYVDSLLGSRLTALLSFISREESLDKDMLGNQKIVDSLGEDNDKKPQKIHSEKPGSPRTENPY